MKKIIVEEPIFEQVEVGTKTVEKWQTSDGELHWSESCAKEHEFRKCKLKERYVYIEESTDATIIEIDCIEDLLRYKDEYVYDDVSIDSKNLTFPNKFVTFSLQELDINNIPRNKYYMVTIEEYKEILLKEIEQQVN